MGDVNANMGKLPFHRHLRAAGCRLAGAPASAPSAARRPTKVARMRVGMLALVPVPLSVGPACADCEGGIAVLARRVSGVTDGHLRTQLLADLRPAPFELPEFDEVACAIALDHAARLLKLGT